MKNRKAKIGIIGCGRIAREGHLPYLKTNKNAEVVAVVDISEKNRAEVCRKFDIPAEFADAVEMMESAQPDGVLICTPNWVHRELTLAAAARGINVFCEKPMAVSAAEAQEMVEACAAAGVTLQMGMVKRFDRGINTIKKMAASGDLGNVSQINTTSISIAPSLDGPLYETIFRWAESLGVNMKEKLGLWRMSDTRTGGGQLLEMGTHLMDLVLYFAGEKPSEWGGHISVKRSDMVFEDQGAVTMKFPSGIIATSEMNMTAMANNLIGENGWIYGDRSSVRFSHINGMWFGLPFYHNIPTLVQKFGPLSPYTGIGLPVPVPATRAIYMHNMQMRYFTDKILGNDTDYFGLGPDFAATGEDGLALMRIIDDIYAKSRPAS